MNKSLEQKLLESNVIKANAFRYNVVASKK